MIQNYIDFALDCFHDHLPHEILSVTPRKVEELISKSKTDFGEINFERLQQIMKVYLEITSHISEMTTEFNTLYPHLKHPITGEAHFVIKAEGWVNIQPMYLYKMMDFENRGIFLKWLEKTIDN